MATFTVNISTSATITTNDLRMALYKGSDPNTAVYFIDEAGPTHAARTWTFPGLEPVNWICRKLEISGGVTLQVLEQFTFTPGSDDVEVKAPFYIEFDVTVIPNNSPNVFTSGLSTFVVSDWIGWDIVAERIGTGTMKPAIDYTWNAVTGTFSLLANGDMFAPNEHFFITFLTKVVTGGGSGSSSVPAIFNQRMTVTGNTTILAEDIGKKILLKITGNYAEVTLPDITSVAENRVVFFEMQRNATMKTVFIKTTGADIMDWLEGGLSGVYICPGESIALYREKDGANNYWRVHDADGNFRQVGLEVNGYLSAGNLTNIVEADGGGASGLDRFQYARLYNRVVLKLPSIEKVAYSSWATGNNKYKYSNLDTGSDKFRIPDLRGIVSKGADSSNVPSFYELDQVGTHDHAFGNYKNDAQGGSQSNFLYLGTDNGASTNTDDTKKTKVNAGSLAVPLENRVKTYRTRRLILC